MSTELESLIASGCVSLSLPVSKHIVARLAAFVCLLSRWNKVYNLTAIRDQQKMVSHHILDSLAIVPYIDGRSLLDIGTGAGIPGMPLALAVSGINIDCLDASAKKLRFVQHVIGELDVENAQTVHSRVEAYHPLNRYDQVMSRAFSSLSDMHTQARHLCQPEGSLLAMKGKIHNDEIAKLVALGVEPEIIELNITGLDAERHLVKWKPGNN
ncbi:MAG: 16S rRNA (guanine(527)-N(7))-methyltransferase RsmG [Gammaproteobacteria bacterium]